MKYENTLSRQLKRNSGVLWITNFWIEWEKIENIQKCVRAVWTTTTKKKRIFTNYELIEQKYVRHSTVWFSLCVHIPTTTWAPLLLDSCDIIALHLYSYECRVSIILFDCVLQAQQVWPNRKNFVRIRRTRYEIVFTFTDARVWVCGFFLSSFVRRIWHKRNAKNLVELGCVTLRLAWWQKVIRIEVRFHCFPLFSLFHSLNWLRRIPWWPVVTTAEWIKNSLNDLAGQWPYSHHHYHRWIRWLHDLARFQWNSHWICLLRDIDSLPSNCVCIYNWYIWFHSMHKTHYLADRKCRYFLNTVQSKCLHVSLANSLDIRQSSHPIQLEHNRSDIIRRSHCTKCTLMRP